MKRRLPMCLVPMCLGLALLLGCEDSARYEQAVAVLIDVSGTYADEKAEVARILKREVLPNLVPGDTIALIRMDSESYDKENIEALVTLDRRPSRANAQKLGLAEKLDEFVATPHRSQYTDIRGGMMLAADYLREVGARSRVVLVFSDMREELPEGSKRDFAPEEFDGVQVAAVNVKQLQSDTADPGQFRDRMALWQADLAGAKASGWRTVLDATHLAAFLSELR